MAGHFLGGVKENPAAANSAESDGLGRFAVDEHNKRQASFAPPPGSSSPSPERSAIWSIRGSLSDFWCTVLLAIVECAAGVRARGGIQMFSPAYIPQCVAFQVMLNVSFSDLAGMVSILPWIHGTFNRELLRSWKRTFKAIHSIMRQVSL
jgi:hypothetical protein